MTPHPSLQLTDEVADALRDGAPVVALESTIISHGMPYPQQRRDGARGRGHHPRRTARCRRRSRCSTAVPRIGLGDDDLELLASQRRRRQGQRPRPAVRRRARRPRRHHRRLDDAARGAGRDPGLRHRRSRRRAPRRAAVLRRQRRPDRARRPPTSRWSRAGVKSILDIGLTLETLETLGVPVLAVGTDEFPSFYSRSSGHARPDARRRRRTRWPRSCAPSGTSASTAAWSSPTRSPSRDEIPAERDRRHHRPGPGRHGRPRHPRQGRDAVPPRPDRRDHRRREPRRPTSRWSATTRASAPRSPRRTPRSSAVGQDRSARSTA